MDLCFGLSTNGLIFFIYFLLFFLGVPLVNETTPSVIVIAPKCYSKAAVCHLYPIEIEHLCILGCFVVIKGEVFDDSNDV